MDTSLKITIMTPELPIVHKNGGIGTFTRNFVHLLTSNGYNNITIVYTSPMDTPPETWRPHYEEMGVDVRTIYQSPEQEISVPMKFDPAVYFAMLACDLIPDDTDILYLPDYLGYGVLSIRQKRFSGRNTPVIATFMHGPSEWTTYYSETYDVTHTQLTHIYNERYVVRYTDYLAAPSQYVFDWAEKMHWKLPPVEKRHVLGYPMLPQEESPPAPPPAETFRKLIFFGRIEKRKGIDLFVESIVGMKGKPAFDSIEEIIFLGGTRAKNPYGSLEDIEERIKEHHPNVSVQFITDKGTDEAQAFLRENVRDTLVVTPSRAETFGFTLIEASLINGLNIIAAGDTGMREVLGDEHKEQYFLPTVGALHGRMLQYLESGPRPQSELGRYDWEAANQRWLNFHEKMCAEAARLKQEAKPTPHISTLVEPRSVDICIPYYNISKYLPYTLESLDNQSYKDFNLFVVNDGSTDPHANEVFEEMQRKYDYDNWHFITQNNTGVGGARNKGAFMGNAPYLMFVDADNISHPNMVERFLEAIHYSGDDLLTCWVYVFIGDGSVYRGGVPMPAAFYYIPVGNEATLNLIGAPFGDANSIIRRSVFEAVGGFSTDVPRGVSEEDRELMTKVVLNGYKLDVIPEYLFFYRERPDSLMHTSHATSSFVTFERTMRHYREVLAKHNLDQLPEMARGLHLYNDMLQQGINTDEASPQEIMESIDFNPRMLVGAFAYKVVNKLLGPGTKGAVTTKTVPGKMQWVANRMTVRDLLSRTFSSENGSHEDDQSDDDELGVGMR